MAIAVEMPKMSDTMEEGVLVSWLKEEGETISAGDVIAQVETDKATMDLEAYDDGVLLKRVIGEGDAVPIGALIAVLGDSGENVDDLIAEYEAAGENTASPPASSTPKSDIASGDGSVHSGELTIAAPAPVAAPQPAPAVSGRLKSSPLARKMARDNNLNLNSVRGSGPEGRIIKRDIEAALQASPGVSVAPQIIAGEVLPDSIRISQMRKSIAKRLSESKFTAPHFYLNVDVDMSRAIEFRNQLKELAEQRGEVKISFNDMITRACGIALIKQPRVNASYMEAEGVIAYHKTAHVAVAVAMEEGLITPVIRSVESKTLQQIALETKELAVRAKNKQLQPDEYSGSTFTTSNLGMFGIRDFTAIINPPNACILAIGAIRDDAVVESGKVVPGKRMMLTMSCDHRVVDGATGAEFLTSVKEHLEQPLSLVL